MFDIGFPELLIVALIALIVLGPNRLPEAMRTLGLIFGRMRRTYMSARAEIEKEIGMDEVRRELHNESIMRDFKSIESSIKDLHSEVNEDIASLASADAEIKQETSSKTIKASRKDPVGPEDKEPESAGKQ